MFFCSYCTGEKGVAYTLLTSADQNFSGDLVRNLVSCKVSFGSIPLVFEGYRDLTSDCRRIYRIYLSISTRKILK